MFRVGLRGARWPGRPLVTGCQGCGRRRLVVPVRGKKTLRAFEVLGGGTTSVTLSGRLCLADSLTSFPYLEVFPFFLCFPYPPRPAS